MSDDPAPTDLVTSNAESDVVAALRREAAARRRELRDVEQERDALRDRVQRGERESLERLATEVGFVDAQDALMLLGDRSHLTDDDGYLSTDKAREALAALAELKPYLCRQPEPPPPVDGIKYLLAHAAPADLDARRVVLPSVRPDGLPLTTDGFAISLPRLKVPVQGIASSGRRRKPPFPAPKIVGEDAPRTSLPARKGGGR